MPLKVAMNFKKCPTSRPPLGPASKTGRRKLKAREPIAKLQARKPARKPKLSAALQKQVTLEEMFKSGRIRFPPEFDLSKNPRVMLQRIDPDEIPRLSKGGVAMDITTKIPSEALENFGISTPTPALTPQRQNSFSPNSWKSATCVVGIKVISDPLDVTPLSPEQSRKGSLVQGSVTPSTKLPHDFQASPEYSSCPSRYSTPSPTLPINGSWTKSTIENITSPLPLAHVNCSTDSQIEDVEECTSSENSPQLLISVDGSYALSQRLLSIPSTMTSNELSYGNHWLRTLAPLALRIGTDSFFPYVAVQRRAGDKYCCILLGNVEQFIIAYSGHFFVGGDVLFDPIKREPVGDERMIFTPQDKLRPLLNLFGVPNKKLVGSSGYFLPAVDENHSDQLISSVYSLLATFDQFRLRDESQGSTSKRKPEEMALPAKKRRL